MDDGYTEVSKNTASGTTTTEFFEFLTPGHLGHGLLYLR